MKTILMHRLISAIIITCVWVMTALPFFSFEAIQPGREFPVHIVKWYGWEHAKSCGLCLFWENNSGGSPFFGDPYTAAQHPFVAIATLLTNPLAATNMTMLYALGLLVLAGVVYARGQRFGQITTVWLASMLMVGGHFMARIEVGSIALPLSLAACVLAFVVCMRWIEEPTRHWGLAAAMAVANLALAGQGYFQLLFVCSLVPLGYVAQRRVAHGIVVRTASILCVMVIVLMLPVLVSYLQFGALMQKEGNSTAPVFPDMLTYLSSFGDADYERWMQRGRDAEFFPYLYSNYIGYIPFVLAGYALIAIWNERRAPHDGLLQESSNRTAMVLWCSYAVIAGLLVSGIPQNALQWLEYPPLTEAVSYLRNVVVVGSMIAVAVVVLSAHGVERFLAALPQWNQSIRVPITRVGPIILSVVLAWQLVIAAQYSARYSALVTYVPDRTGLLSYLIDQPTQYLSVATDMQFLDVLQSHHKNFWNLYYPYHPEDVPAIEPAYTLSADDLSDVATWVPVEFFDEWLLYRNTRPDASYATLGNASTDAPTPCRVHAEAGSIDLWCDTRRPEQLIVHEYAFPDWMVTIDGVPAPLIPGEFLSVELPAGAQVVSFRYRPWLVIGAAAIAAIAWCIGLALLLWTSMHPLMSRRLLRTSDAPTSV